MSIAVLTPAFSSQHPVSNGSFGLDSSTDVLQRIATIVRRYATDRVAIRGGVVEVELDTAQLPAGSLEEQARRLAVLARSWTGRAVRHEVWDREEASVASVPFRAPGGNRLPSVSVSVAIREGEDAVATAGRVARAIRRLEAISTDNATPAGFILRLQRGDRETAMPLPRSVLESETLERWLPPASLRGVTAIHLESRVRRDTPAARRSPRNPVRSAPAPALSRVS